MRTIYGAGARAPLFGNGPGLFGARVALRDASKEPEPSDRSGLVDAYGVHVSKLTGFVSIEGHKRQIASAYIEWLTLKIYARLL